MEKLINITGIILTSILTILIFSVVGIILCEKKYSSKYQNTSLKIPENEFEKSWGKPTRIMVDKNGSCTKVLFYDTFLTYYAFNFDKDKLLTAKYQD